jgi:hypothetical protein
VAALPWPLHVGGKRHTMAVEDGGATRIARCANICCKFYPPAFGPSFASTIARVVFQVISRA